MINPQTQRITKIVELLEQMNLFSSDDITLMEDYLSGTVEEQALEKLPFQDLSAVPKDISGKMSAQLLELRNKGRYPEATKLGDLLFAIGQSTCCDMFPIQNYSIDKEAIPVTEPAKKVAVCAARIGMNEFQLNCYALQNLLRIADNDPAAVRKALDYQKAKKENGRLILLTLYFRLKYDNVRLVPETENVRQGGILAGVNKLLGRGEDKAEPTAVMSAEDARLFEQYEKILVFNLNRIYQNRLQNLVADEIENAVYRDQLSDRILKLANPGFAMDRFMLRLLGGTAFVNYAQSPRLKNVVTVCLAADMSMTLSIIDHMDLRGEISKKEGNFSEIFRIPPQNFISWAARNNRTKILKSQFVLNRESFLECMNTSNFNSYNLMNAVISELDPKLYQERRGREIYRQQAGVVEEFVKLVDAQHGNMVRDYLNGATDIQSLYPDEDKLQRTGSRWSGNHWNALSSYQQGYGYDAFSNRCEAFLMIYRGYCNTSCFRLGNELSAANVKRIFAAANTEKLSLKHQLNTYADAYDSFYVDRWKEAFRKAAKEVFRDYLKGRREEMILAFQEADSTGRCLGLQILSEEPAPNKTVILGFAQDSSKAVREELLNILYEQKGWEEDFLRLLSSKKATARETAIRVLTRWDSEKYAPALTQALEKEKNGKVRTLLETALHVSSAGEKAGGRAITQEDLVKELHKGGKKRSLAWAYETPFSKVHKKNGEEAEEEYLQAVFLSYASMSPYGVSPTAVTLAEGLDERELAIYANELFDKWMEAGAESKKRWVLYAASIHGGADIVKKLQHWIQEWPLASRGAIASDAVQALALSPQPQALLIVDGISRKFKFKQVKAAAGKALEFAASQLGITTEELADRIVPDLGFNENMERSFDYGERKFTVTITTALEIEVFDENGKKLKSLPAPGKRDDEAKAAAAYEEFKQMKKQMKTTVSSQKMRLEMALSTERQWSIEAWKNLFVKNPVMHQFATGLIWGIYEDRKLVASFRYMEDGSFNTEDEDEFELPESARTNNEQTAIQAANDRDTQSADKKRGQLVGIVHPIELSEESLKTWKEQLEDYEITQPIEQLDRPVYHMTKEEENQKSLERFGGCIVNDLSLGGKLQALGWYKGSVQDGGGFYSYYREDKELFLGVELHFSGSFVGGENEDVTVYEARFYNAGGTVFAENGGVITGGIKRGSYVYDEANDSNSYFLKEVPERYFSEIVLQLSKATASSKERNVNWKTHQ